MINYQEKSRLLKTDLCKRINAIDKATYLNCKEGIVYDQDVEDKYFALTLDYSLEEIKEGRRINKATYTRRERLRSRILAMLESGHCIWCTFTWKNKVFKTTNEETRRQYVRRHLNSFNCPYIANIDYGSDNEYISRKKQVKKGTQREHYHAIIQIDKLPMKWSFGWEYLEHITIEEDTTYKMSKYLNKLTNHAIKESARGRTLIYSRMKTHALTQCATSQVGA